MLEIVVYGPGCARCKETERRVGHAGGQAGLQANVRKATDIVDLAQAGVLTTPAVAVNGVVKVAGRIPETEEILAWLAAAVV
jgi:small redox-active disulfide protein 2